MIPQNVNILKFPVLPQNGMETVHMHLNKYFIEREGVFELQGPPEGHKMALFGKSWNSDIIAGLSPWVVGGGLSGVAWY